MGRAPASGEAVKEKKASTHCLWHTLGRVWVDRGGDLRVLAEILGHSNPATTAIYSRADEKRRRQESISVNGVACRKRVVLWVKSG